MAGAVNDVMIQRVSQPVNRFPPCLAIADQLGDHRVVEHGNLATLGNPAVNANPLTRRFLIALEATDGGQEIP